MRRLASCALAAAAFACGVPEVGPTMAPGQDCINCHRDVAPSWTVAGTVFGDPAAQADGGVAGAQVLISDSAGKELTLTSNSAGNFYTAEPLAFPIRVQIQRGNKRMAMSDSPPRGSCNSCHSLPRPADQQDVPGRLFAPGN